MYCRLLKERKLIGHVIEIEKSHLNDKKNDCILNDGRVPGLKIYLATLVAPVPSVPKTQLVCRNPSERL